MTKEKLLVVWKEYAEEKKNQVAEYHLLNRDVDFENNQVTIHLTNPVEEPLLQAMRTQLVTFLREKLRNSSINVVGQLKEITTQKIAYTNKEKFDHLAKKNPLLLEMKEKFGLDPDF